MSYGIICREASCREYAEWRRVMSGGKLLYLCIAHRDAAFMQYGLFSTDFESITAKEHKGPEGMKSVEEQKLGL